MNEKSFVRNFTENAVSPLLSYSEPNGVDTELRNAFAPFRLQIKSHRSEFLWKLIIRSSNSK
jgi:hypothetical protein